MNQAQVKTNLMRLRPETEDFELGFTGKKSKKHDGYYKVEEKAIFIHDGNLESDELIMYTAIHEFAHHIHFTSYDGMVNQTHGPVFKKIMHDLLDEAERQGTYKPSFRDNEEIKYMVEKTRKLMEQQAAITKQIGKAFADLFESCTRHNCDIADIRDRIFALTTSEAKQIMTAFYRDLPEDMGKNKMLYCSRIKDPDNVEIAVRLLKAGKSQEQADSVLKPEKYDIDNIDMLEFLQKEKVKNETMIDKCTDVVDKIIRKINALTPKIKRAG